MAAQVIWIPIRTGRGLNERGHWATKARRVKAEREATQWALVGAQKPALPCVVLLTRVGPSNGLDDDQIPGSLKATRDQIAEWIGVDDRHRDIVRYRYDQRRGSEWGVEVEFLPGEENGL